ncbi:sugar ABC transporter permease [Salisediminibacterium beveridgei]|uniref:Xylose transport system permease protein XylH n=1 Tax=Salisediminibacterium beveridgei TaxID=632773 RepID=A0A1D7QRG5_9BACI|nr:sugar ABC transporter permease [Salisediminibacterium beveridgei]AOM81591.1 Xylose transport system permease protein xylH [Salisediminibacterium beveridgei]
MKNKLSFKVDMRAYTLILALLLIFIVFTIMTNGDFISSRNLTNLSRQMTVIGVLAVGMTLIIVAGHIDLSVGSLLGLTGGIAAILQVWYGWSTIPVIIVTILAGVVLGLWQGWWVAYKGVPAFIVTLGGMMIFRGILLGISGGQTVAPMNDSFRAIGQAFIPYAVGYGLLAAAIVLGFIMAFRKRQRRETQGLGLGSPVIDYGTVAIFAILATAFVYMLSRYHGIPVPLLILLVVAGIFIFISKNTTFGRHIYAIGGNKEAARLSGINIKRNVLYVFVLMGALSAVAGIILTSRLNAGTVGAGNMYELDAIAAVVIGGTSLMGGVGTIVGSILGALIMASIDNGMSMMNVAPFWQYIVKGLILILAVYLDISSKKKNA